jgi:hypothetical protein
MIPLGAAVFAAVIANRMPPVRFREQSPIKSFCQPKWSERWRCSFFANWRDHEAAAAFFP